MKVVELENGGTWYIVAVHYPTTVMAKKAWERAQRKLSVTAGDAGIGVLRMTPRPGGGRATGAPRDVYPVVALTRDEATAQKAEHILNDGESWMPNDDLSLSLIARRARVVLEHTGQGAGRLVIRRAEGRGAELDREGVMHEPPPPQG